MRKTSDIRVRQTGSDIGKFPHAWVRATWGCEQGQVGLSRVGSGSAVGQTGTGLAYLTGL